MTVILGSPIHTVTKDNSDNPPAVAGIIYNNNVKNYTSQSQKCSFDVILAVCNNHTKLVSSMDD